MKDKINAVMDRCGCTRDEAEGELRRRGLDVEATVKSISGEARKDTSRLRESMQKALKKSSHIAGMDQKKAQAIQQDIERQAELADQGWEEVGARKKLKKELARIKEARAQEKRKEALNKSRAAAATPAAPAPAQKAPAKPRLLTKKAEEKKEEPKPVAAAPAPEPVAEEPKAEAAPAVEEPKEVEEVPKKEEEKPVWRKSRRRLRPRSPR